MMTCLKFFILGLTVVCAVARAEVRVVKDFSEIEKIYSQVLADHKPEDVLGLWDIDMTLLHYQDPPAVQMANIRKHRSALRDLLKPMSSDQIKMMFTYARATSHRILGEDVIPKVLERLQGQGVRMLALTASLSGILADVDLEQQNFDDLKDNGIDFSHSFPSLIKIHFKDLPGVFDRHPVYSRGILCASTGRDLYAGKGATLVAFFKSLHFSPKVVIFADDRDKNLTDVEAALKEFDPTIRVISLHYKGKGAVDPVEISEKEFLAYWTELAKKSERA